MIKSSSKKVEREIEFTEGKISRIEKLIEKAENYDLGREELKSELGTSFTIISSSDKEIYLEETNKIKKLKKTKTRI